MSNEELNNIRLNADIVDIIGSYIPLTQKGKNYFSVCPFHDDHSPSMSISKDKQIYKCFSCGASGNVFTFVQNYENVSFGEAVASVASKIGMALQSSPIAKKPNKFKAEFELFRLVGKFYQNNLNTASGTSAKEYLANRGITEAMIREFGIGLALPQNDALYKLLSNKNYEKKYLNDLGLINISAQNIYDVFTNRIVFPLEDSEGNVIAFNGRIYDNTNAAKYVNLKETYIFKKGQILYNYHRAKSAAKRDKCIIIVEGNLDAIRLYALGVENVVALMGTSFTKEQTNLIKKLRVPVILCLDNDSAGYMATYSIGEALIKENVIVSVVRLSDAKDPDEYVVKKGIEAFAENIKNPVNFFEFKLTYLKEKKNLNNTEELAEYINEVIANLNTMDDDILKELTLSKLSKEYDISLELLREKLDMSKKKEIKTVVNVQEFENKELKKTKYQISAEQVLYYMMNNVVYIKSYLRKLGYFPDREHRDIANEIIYYYEKNKSMNIADFITFIGNNERVSTKVQALISKINSEELDEDLFEEYIKVIKKTINKAEIEKVKLALKNELDVNKKMELAKKLVELKKEV